jgi:DNA-binding beta-propeller fold protein YncE
MKFLLKIYLFFLIVSSLGCKKDAYGPQQEITGNSSNNQPTVNTTNARLIICNEGNFNWGNASLSVYYPHNNLIENNVFSSVNNKPLGDVAQSTTVVGNKLYIIVNNSNKIEVIDKNTYQSLATITGFNSPRYMVTFGSKGYVSDLYQNAIYVVDLNSNQITGQIPVNGWCEHLLKWGDTLLIEAINDQSIYFLNTTNNQIFDTLNFSSEMPSGMVLDNNNKLWILFSGGTVNQIPSLYRINLTNRSIEKQLMFFPNSNPKYLVSPNRQDLYFLHNGIKKMHINDSTLPSNVLIPESNHLFYSLTVDSISGDIYVSDAKDYVQQGQILRYNSNYTLVDSFMVGIIPGFMQFDYQ